MVLGRKLQALAHHGGTTTSLHATPGLLFNCFFLTSAFTVIFYTTSHTDLSSKYSFPVPTFLAISFLVHYRQFFHADSWLSHIVTHLCICFARGNMGSLTAHHIYPNAWNTYVITPESLNTGGGSSTVLCYLRECSASPSFRAWAAGSNPALLILTHFVSVPRVWPDFPLDLIPWQQTSSSAYLFCQFSLAASPNKHTAFPSLSLQLQDVKFGRSKTNTGSVWGQKLQSRKCMEMISHTPPTQPRIQITPHLKCSTWTTHTRSRSLSSLSWCVPVVLYCTATQKTSETPLWDWREYKARLLQQFWHFSILQFSVIAPDEG